MSQYYQWKDLLLEILSNVSVLDDNEVWVMKEEELAETLYRHLKRQRFLIVMDDIWDIEAPHQLTESFPNDSNGSRILLTSRIHRLPWVLQQKLVQILIFYVHSPPNKVGS